MTTTLHKPVKRRTNEVRRDRSKMRPIIITLYPAGHLGLRLEGTRREETIPMQAIFERAVKMRIAAEATARLQKKADKAGVSLAHYVRRKRR
jgi:hypothetical protein